MGRAGAHRCQTVEDLSGIRGSPQHWLGSPELSQLVLGGPWFWEHKSLSVHIGGKLLGPPYSAVRSSSGKGQDSST